MDEEGQLHHDKRMCPCAPNPTSPPITFSDIKMGVALSDPFLIEKARPCVQKGRHNLHEKLAPMEARYRKPQLARGST